jgi:protein-S-isoprenylcysteine O-methyltransferase Ste14
MHPIATEIAAYVMLAATVCNAFALLWLQCRAFSAHRHKSFLVLAISTVVALATFLAGNTAALLPALKPWQTEIQVTIAALYVLYASLGIWGVYSLFRSYGELKQARMSPGSTSL